MTRDNRSILLLFLAASLLAGAAGAQQGAGVDPAAFPEVVARVAGQPIRKVELLTQAEIMRAQARRAGAADPGGELEFYREVLDGLIGEVLVYQYSQAQGIGASDEEVAAKVAEMRARFPDEAAFDAALAEQGTDRAELERQLRQTLSVQGFIENEIAARIQMPEATARAFYDANLERLRVPERRRVRHILLRAARDASTEVRDEARALAAALSTRIRAGTDFAGLAKIHSQDEASREQGGELGWIVRSGRRPEFEAAAFALQPGQLSEVVETAAGYHLIELLEVEPGKTPSFEELRPRIEQRLRNEAIQREIQQRVESLRLQNEAEIEILI